MGAWSVRRRWRWAPTVLVLLFGIACGFGLAFAGYKLQTSYILVENSDLAELVGYYNDVVRKCRRIEPLW